MNQAELTHLVSSLRINLGRAWLKPRKLGHYEGYRGSLEKMRRLVTALIVNERVEYKENHAMAIRPYTERLIQLAVEHGDRHKYTMEMASWWLDGDRAAIHKLFKVIAPRYQDYSSTTPFTRLFFAPMRTTYPSKQALDSRKVLLELRDNPFPPLKYPNQKPNRNHLHNVLLAEAKKDKRMKATGLSVP